MNATGPTYVTAQIVPLGTHAGGTQTTVGVDGITALSVTPSQATLQKNQTLRLVLGATPSDGSAIVDPPVNFTVSPSNGGASLAVAADGTYQFSSGPNSGTYVVTFSTATVSATATITVLSGTVDVVTSNFSQAVNTIAADRQGIFRTAGSTTGFTNPRRIAAGDFNGDGKLDVVTADITDGFIQIALGNGDGTFQAPTTIDSGVLAVVKVVAADVNGDGKLDLVVTGQDSVTVLLGNGDGTFGAPTPLSIAASNFQDVAVADFNGDGFPDIAVSSVSGVGLWVCLNNGASGPGTFQAGRNVLPAGANDVALDIAAADLNRDGKLDLVCTGEHVTTFPGGASVGNNLIVLLGNGDGTFQAPLDDTFAFPCFDIGRHLTVADFNGDGKLDVAVTSINAFGTNTSMAILLGNGDGTFGTPSILPLGDNPAGIAVADFNADGHADIVVTCVGGGNNPNELMEFLGNGDGTFAPSQNYDVGVAPSNPVVGDFGAQPTGAPMPLAGPQGPPGCGVGGI